MTGDRVLKGIGLRLIAIFFLSTMSALIKLAESHAGDAVRNHVLSPVLRPARRAGLCHGRPAGCERCARRG